MCGIVGCIDGSKVSRADDLRAIVGRMSDQIMHRGPDDSGAWTDAAAGVAVGHRRLSIIDTSPLGHQPMVSADGHLVMVFNGEIYNFAELREELESAGHHFRGHSDTEVLLAGFCQWGFENTLKKTVGMFALALWDKSRRRLHLARDRMGEKPLYYGWQQNVFMFCSELKGLRAHPAWCGEVDRDSITSLMRYGFVPAPRSIYRGIHKLPAASCLTLNCERLTPGHCPAPHEYWSLRERAEFGAANPFTGSASEAVSALETTLKEAVRRQMVADVPLGAFLSGGIDSSTVVALMQAQSTRPVKTFSIGFHEPDYNEALHAQSVAQHLGTDHTELYVTAEEAMAVIPALPRLYDEPFADSSQIPTYLVAQLARRHVKVSLSGDGGDELFCGYQRYETALQSWKKIAALPNFVQQGVRAVIANAPADLLNVALKIRHPALVGYRRSRHDWRQIASRLQESSGEAFYRRLMSHWPDPAALVNGSVEPPDAFTDETRWADLPDFAERMMYIDAITYLPDDILVKVDRAAMGVALETRVPLLDHRVVEFAWRVPMSLKRRDGQGKWLLRQVLDKYVPRELVERPKKGFALPVGAWLRGPLRDWAESLLSESRLKNEGFFDPSLVRQAWNEHLAEQVDQEHLLWNVLMFQSWQEHTQASSAASAAQVVPA